MRASFGLDGGFVTFHRDSTDPKFYGVKFAKGEHALFHYLKGWLNDRGFSLVKKRVQADGHLMGDEYQPYLRATNVMIVSQFYALRGAEEDWNGGTVTLGLVCDEQGAAAIRRLCRQHRDMVAA